MSEEFGGALPSVIWAEQQRLPVGFLERVIEMRDYARAKRMVDAADTQAAVERLPTWDLIDLAKDITLTLADEERAGR